MSDISTRRSAMSQWLREVSALLLVFPVVDQLVLNGPGQRFDWTVAVGGATAGLLLLGIGLTLIKERAYERPPHHHGSGVAGNGDGIVDDPPG
jgi:hypothetical protein